MQGQEQTPLVILYLQCRKTMFSNIYQTWILMSSDKATGLDTSPFSQRKIHLFLQVY